MEPKFENMKRAELQKCAKNTGIRANMKTDELIKALVAYHSQNNPNAVEKDVPAAASDKVDSESELTVEAKPQRLQKGRGRGRGRGRKQTSPPDNKSQPEPLQSSSSSESSQTNKGKKGKKKTGPGEMTGATVPPTTASPEDVEAVIAKLTAQGDCVRVLKSRTSPKPKVTDVWPKSDVETKKDNTVKTGRKPVRRKRSSVAKTPLEGVKTPKSAQKRTHSDIEEETELPPAKQQKVSPSQKLKKKIEPVPPTRKSSRKRTFSMSPKSEGEEKSNQSEQKVTRVDGDEESSSANEKRETGAKRKTSGSKREDKPETTKVELKTSPKKSVRPTRMTGIPLPKIKASENVTPGKPLNFKKVHKAQFEKLESIDDYLERKRKRIEALTQSHKKAPSCSKNTPKKTPKAVTPKAPSCSRKTPAKKTRKAVSSKAPSCSKNTPKKTPKAVTPKAPSCSRKTPAKKTRKAVSSKDCKSVKSTMKRTSFFTPKPSNQTSKTVTFHASRLKTPLNPSTFAFGKSSIEKRIPTPGARKSFAVTSSSVSRKSFSVTSSSVSRKSMAGDSTTPFKFTSSSINTPSRQKTFDLKASLEMPLTYKPYTGKLKPLSEIQPIKPQPITRITKAKENLKKPKLGSRQERQRATTKQRAQTRQNNMMSRRGLSVA